MKTSLTLAFAAVNRRDSAFRLSRRSAAAILATIVCASASRAETFVPTSGTQSYNLSTNWTPQNVPNSVGASAIFNNPTAAEIVELRAAITVGSLSFTNHSTFTLTLANGTGGSLTLDAAGNNEATITVGGTSSTTNNITISASTTLNDTLRFTNNNVSGTGSGTATMTGTVSGAGGFIKDGPGRFTFSTTAKTYTGATLVNQGRLRYTGSGQSPATSAITVSSGGSLYLDQTSGVFSFGGGTALITINGDGDNGGGTGTQGALRNQGTGTTTLANAVALASDATIHVDGSSILQLNGGISGSATLLKGGGGTLNFTTANAGYIGGTTVSNGTVLVASASKLGSGALAFAQTTGNSTAVTLNNATQSISSLSSAFVDTTGTQSQTLTLNGTALTINQTGNTSFGNGAVSTLTSTIQGSGSVTLSNTSTGTLTLTGANTYTGATTISGGTLEAAAAGALGSGTTGTASSPSTTAALFSSSNSATSDHIKDTAPITLAGGAITLNGVAEGSNSAIRIGALTLASNSTIDLAATSLVHFAASTSAAPGAVLSILDWSGTAGTGGGAEILKFGSANTDLTYIGQLQFVNPAGFAPGTYAAMFASANPGEVVPDGMTPVPEPSTWAAGLLTVAAVAYAQRRRLATSLARLNWMTVTQV